MKKSTIQKTVDETNAQALKTYESGVAAIVTGIKQSQANIASATVRFEQDVQQQATYIAQQRAQLVKLTPPPAITAVEIFGAEVVQSATE